MGYTKQNFIDDEYLYAEQLSKMEDAIINLEKGGGSSVDVTGLEKQVDDLTEVSGKVINQNGGDYVRLWFGTEAEYKALGVAEPDVLYCLFEESSSGSDNTSDMTPAILGVAVLGKTILGVTSVFPKLATPGIALIEN